MASSATASVFHEQSDTIDLGEIGRLIRRRIGFIAAIVLLTTVLSLLHVFFAVPQFTSRGTIYLGDAQGADGNNGNVAGNGNFLYDYTNESDVETQIELITSEALIKNAILETGLNTQIQVGDAVSTKYWHWKFIEGGRISAYLPGPDALQVLNAQQPGKFRVVLGQNGTYRLYTEGGLFEPSQLVLTGVLGQPGLGNGVSLLIRPALADFTGKPGQVYHLTVVSPDGLAEGLLNGGLNVNAGGSTTQPTKIAFLQVRWDNPYQAEMFLNQVMSDFIETQQSWKTQSASTTQIFVADQLDKVNTSLAAADQNLAAYQSQTGLVDVTQNAQTTIQQLSQYEAQRTALELQISALSTLDDELHKPSAKLDPYLVSQTNDAVLTSLTGNLADAELKLSQADVQYTNEAADVQVDAADVANLKGSIRTIIDNDLRGSNASLVSLNKIIDNFQQKIKTMPAEALKVLALQRSSDVLGELYGVLMQKEEEAEVSKAATIINTRIVTPARVPLYVTSPKGFIAVVFGAFIGLVLGAGLVFAQYAFSGKFETNEQVRNAVPLPISGEIPKQLKADLTNGVLIGRGRQRFTEAFRLLRGSIYRIAAGKLPMVVLVTSALEGDGKTTVALNLAKVLAEDDKKVVLVDADFYSVSASQPWARAKGKPDWLNMEMEQGLADWPGEKFKAFNLSDFEAAGLNVLNAKAIQLLFAQLRRHFDYIIVDCPPLPAISDAMTLGLVADLILSVVKLSYTKRRVLMVHNELLSTLNVARGLVVNAVENQGYERSSKY